MAFDPSVTPEDDTRIRALYARYCHYFDANRIADWAGLFTADGSFTRVNAPPAGKGGSGLPAETATGRAALVALGERAQASFRGLMRHQQTDIFIDMTGPDSAEGTSYGLITDWRDGPGRIAMIGTYRTRLARQADGWRFASVAIDILPR